MSAAVQADRVREAQFRIEAGHGTPEDFRLLEVDRLRWGADIAASFCIDAYGDPAVTRIGGQR